MNSLMVRLWNDDCGYVLSAESMFLFTITVLGLIAGWTSLRNSVASELSEVGNAIHALSQAYTISQLASCGGGANNNSVTDAYSPVSITVSAPTSTGNVDVNACF